MNPLRPLSTIWRARWLAAALLLAGAARAETSVPWPTLPLPPHSNVEWVADRMKVNGIPMRVMRFESTVSRSEIVAFYTAHWSGGYKAKPSVRPLGEATLVGQLHGPYYMTVKVSERPNNASAGFISVSQLLGNAVVRDAGDFPLIPGARVVSVVESSDPGQQSRELVIEQDAGAGVAGNYYRAALENAGWRQVQKTIGGPAEPQQAGSLEVYRRDASELSISVIAAGGRAGSSVIATIVTKGTGSPAQ
jgi:hypothetical protein